MSLPMTLCIVWTGLRHKAGYGRIRTPQHDYYAHRYLYLTAHGLPYDHPEHVLHSCDNPSCVNLHHLRLGDASDNAHDRARRKRGRETRPDENKGQFNPNASLTYDDVAKIRSMYAAGNWTQAALGELFGVKQQAISKIVNYKLWEE